ncbi:MAG: hypothetical protein GC204_12985 [Chloroflexi bacterium]|nr:hypothetical protein [Chloroflexota bacterium]
MAHKIEWIEEPWIMRVTYVDRMTAEDVEMVMKVCIEAVDKHPANFLVDFSNISFHESNLFRSKALINLFRHRNTRWFAFLGLTGIMHTAASALMMRTPFKSFTNEQEAVDFLRQKAETQKVQAEKLSQVEKPAAAH